METKQPDSRFIPLDADTRLSHSVRILLGIAAVASMRRGDTNEAWLQELESAKRVIERAIEKSSP